MKITRLSAALRLLFIVTAIAYSACATPPVVSTTSTTSVNVPGAVATDLPIDPQYYGLTGDNGGPVTYSVFGPTGLRSNGDAFSVQSLSNGTPNPDYTGTGYDFTISVPSDYATRNGTSVVPGLFKSRVDT